MARRPGDIRLLYHHFEQSEKSLSFAVRNSRFPHMCHALLRFPHLSFIPPVPYPPLRGTFPMRGRLCIGDSDTLVYDALETIFSLSFIPLVPYPARFARHLPHAGKALSVVILFPHIRVFALTMREKRYSRIVVFPLGEGGTAQRRPGALVNDALVTIFPALFHPASPIQPPPLRGTSFHRKEGVSTRAPSLGRGCRAQQGGVGFRSRLKRNGKRRSLVSSSRAQPRDLFRFPFPFSFVMLSA